MELKIEGSKVTVFSGNECEKYSEVEKLVKEYEIISIFHTNYEKELYIITYYKNIDTVEVFKNGIVKRFKVKETKEDFIYSFKKTIVKTMDRVKMIKSFIEASKIGNLFNNVQSSCLNKILEI